MVITDSNGCVVELDGIEVGSLSSFALPHPDSRLEVWPNPVHRFVNIERQNIPGELQVTFYNMDGTRILGYDLASTNNDRHRISLEALNPGMYVVVFEGYQLFQVRKIIKQ